MAVLTFPLVKVSAARRALESATGVSRSVFTGTEQVQFWGGEWWAYEIEMAITKGDDGRALMAFFTSLRGRKNTFTFADPTAAYSGSLVSLGAPLVNGAAQVGDSLVTDGWAPGIVLKSGMFFSIGSGALARLHMLTADVAVDGSGNATLPIAPALRYAPNNDAALEYTAPIVHLRLDGPVPADMAPADLYRFSFRAREAL